MQKRWVAVARGFYGPAADTPEQAALQFFAEYPAWRKHRVFVREEGAEPGVGYNGVTYEMAVAGI